MKGKNGGFRVFLYSCIFLFLGIIGVFIFVNPFAKTEPQKNKLTTFPGLSNPAQEAKRVETAPAPPPTPIIQKPAKTIQAVTQQLRQASPELQEIAAQKAKEAAIPDAKSPLSLPQEIKAPPVSLPQPLVDLFFQFDANKDDTLNIDEAVAFYYWMQKNVKYRFDDERIAKAPKGIEIGDGREGPDYRQTSLETITEGFGDCEDTATLAAAFYNFWGIPAYVAGVNAQDAMFVDHAIAIVRIAGDLNNFVDLLGGLMYWDFKPDQEIISCGNTIIPPGYYMLLDSAYSRNFGFLTKGLKGDGFKIQAVIPAEAPFGEQWDKFINTVNFSWTN